VNDITPPTVRLLTPNVTAGARLRLGVTDTGSGVDPQSLVATVDGESAAVTFAGGRATVALAGVARGRHRIVLQAADYQELKNMENVPQILPNTRSFTARFMVR
jgi:hypothetical protein